jgi:hypothetical protein
MLIAPITEKVIAGSWDWTDAALFIAVFVAIRITVIYIATKAFVMMIPDGDQCLMCDGETLAIQRDGWWRVLGPRFRRSWCLSCGWEGLLRRSIVPSVFAPTYDPARSVAKSASHSGQFPLNSKKSSK